MEWHSIVLSCLGSCCSSGSLVLGFLSVCACVEAWRDWHIGVFSRCGTGHVWTLGLVQHPVTLSKLLIV